MSSFAMISASTQCPVDAIESDRDFVPLILQAMADKNLHFRELAKKTGISRTRIGLLLHSEISKRPNMSLIEFQRILHALDINIIQAVISVENHQDPKLMRDERFTTLILMLSELFHGLPSMLVAALDELDGIDGTEVRKEWAGPLKDAVVRKIVKEVAAVMARRSVLSDLNNF